jgi:hypothetical protein
LAAGAGKHTLVLLADQEPELMLKMAQHFCLSIDEVIARLAACRSNARPRDGGVLS